MARAHDNAWGPSGTPEVSPVPEVQFICAEDFRQVEEWRDNPPEPTQGAREASRLFYQLLRNS